MLQKSSPDENPISFSVVVPVFNSAPSLPLLVRELSEALGNTGMELILVNDGSRDNSWSVIQELAQSQPWVRGIDLMRNYGQHSALLAGIRAARGDVVITMDDDLQNPPHEAPKLLAKLAEGHDVVYGAPVRESHGFVRNLASQFTKLVLQTAMNAETARNVSAFRAFRTDLRTAFERYSGTYVSIDVLLTWATDRFAVVRVESRPRTIGVSNYTVRKLVTHAMNMMTGFSTLPLKIGSMVGFALTTFGAGVLVFVLVNYLLHGGAVPGFAFLASLTCIFSGAQLFALGIFGEYLGRMYTRSMEKPPYSVRSATGSASRVATR